MKFTRKEILETMNQILQKEIKLVFEKKDEDYPFYVVNTKTKKIASGWDYREDAKDFIDDLKETHPDKVKDLKIFSQSHVKNNLKIDFLNQNNWYNV